MSVLTSIQATTNPQQAEPIRRGHSEDQHWATVRESFLNALEPQLRPIVAGLLRQPRCGGLGLRMWLRTLANEPRAFPESLPSELVQVYLNDPEAVPLHDCAGCGLAVPVRPGRSGYESEPQRVYFPTCPCCGCRTGLHAYWSSATRK